MLNQRQIGILLEFCNHPGEFLTATYFAKQLDVSLRTVQGDIKTIRKELEKETCASLCSTVSKGSFIRVEDTEGFAALIDSLYQKYVTVSLNYPVSRISQILLLLLSRHRAVSLSEMEDLFFVSKSTLLNDLKRVEKILGRYQLELMRSSQKIMVDGYEINKRRCLSEQDLYLAYRKGNPGNSYMDEKQIAKLKTILSEVFVEQKYHIMDTEFSNTILFLNIMVCRMGDGFYIGTGELGENDCIEREYEISRRLFEKIGRRCFIQVSEEEIRYFALYLGGQGNYQYADRITPEMDAFILKALENIKEQFGVDLTENINLRITLALHCMALKIRIQYDMQLKNDMVDYIRESFPLGYDIASYFAWQIQEVYHKKVLEEETALLAIHFYSSLLEIKFRANKSKILVISSLKNSMTMLLKQTLQKWFSDYVSAIDFIRPSMLSEEVLDAYDVFLTTEKGEVFEKGLAMYINPLPGQHDYMNIKLNIDGFQSIEDVIAIFNPQLFQIVDSGKKELILEEICHQAERVYDMEGLYEQILKREEIGSTFFSRHIAVPHPLDAVSSNTFVSAVISKTPIPWDEEGNKVHLILLLHVGKNNAKAFPLWEYLSKLFADKRLLDRLMKQPDYENFIQLIKEVLELGIHHEER